MCLHHISDIISFSEVSGKNRHETSQCHTYSSNIYIYGRLSQEVKLYSKQSISPTTQCRKTRIKVIIIYDTAKREIQCVHGRSQKELFRIREGYTEELKIK